MTESRVLLIPCVLALLGDNPMQSEFACHIGLRGKFFCRVCGVKGKDAKAEDSAGRPLHTRAVPPSSDEDSDADAQSIGSADTQGKKKTRTKFKEGLAAMTERVKAFIQVW